jgi:hypothetical protein
VEKKDAAKKRAIEREKQERLETRRQVRPFPDFVQIKSRKIMWYLAILIYSKDVC